MSFKTVLSLTSYTLAGFLAFGAVGAQAQSLKPSLSLATAKKIAQGCEERARKEGWNMGSSRNSV